MQQIGNVEPTKRITFENVKPSRFEVGREGFTFVCPKLHICVFKQYPIYIAERQYNYLLDIGKILIFIKFDAIQLKIYNASINGSINENTNLERLIAMMASIFDDTVL